LGDLADTQIERWRNLREEANADNSGAWLDTLFSTTLSVFAALVIDLALFCPLLQLSPRDLMPSAFTLKDPI
jgi:hypothetical protein